MVEHWLEAPPPLSLVEGEKAGEDLLTAPVETAAARERGREERTGV